MGFQTDKDVEEFVRKNYSDVYRYLYHKVHSVHDAQELTQETFLRFARRADDVSSRNRAYLFTIARNIAIDFYRGLKPETRELDEALADTLPAPQPSDDGFEEAIARLPEEQRDILSLKYAIGFGENEIATITGLSRFSVRRRLKRALSELEESWKGPTP